VTIDKLAAITENIGSPTSWNDYSNLQVANTNFYSNYFTASLYNTKPLIQGIQQKRDKSAWVMNPSTVNAAYVPINNDITITAAILSDPVFNITSHPYFQNYGSLGSIIGHEYTHGFDNSGREYDKNGRQVETWSDSSITKFETQAQCVVNFYQGNTYHMPSSISVKGRQTLGENIADCGGIKEAYYAYIDKYSSIQSEDITNLYNGLDHKQLFFVSYAQNWCTKYVDEYLAYLVAVDVHSPGPLRILGPLANFDEFSNAFKCSANTKFNPSNKCTVW